MEKISEDLKMRLMNAVWVCHECGDKYGDMPDDHVYTIHMDTCDVCGEEKTFVTEPRDYRYFKKTLNPKN